MILIAHRGNTNGSNLAEENKPSYIRRAYSLGYHVEIDVWNIHGNIYLGHDKPTYFIEDLTFLTSMRERLVLHFKNIQCTEYKIFNHFNFFAHDVENFVVTSFNWGWTVQEKLLTPNSIWVINSEKHKIKKDVLGICTDYAGYYSSLSKQGRTFKKFFRT